MATLSSQLILSLVDKVTGPARGIGGALSRIDSQVGHLHRNNRALMAPLTGFGARLLAFGGAYVGLTQGIKGTAGAALSFESAMANVRKVVDANDEQFANMRRDIIGLSKVMPVTAEGFAAIYEAAGQSDIARDELKGFAEGVVRVSTAWDTTVETTGDSLAKIKSALGRDIPGVFRLADAINHVSNVSAASAPDMLEYTNRVAAFAETAGFSAEQALAFGGAMVGSGFEPEVAATSFRNLTKALTIGTKATKAQRKAYKALGLDAVTTAKRMQKDAVGTTLEVIDKIKGLPEWQQISIASALFGDEARGLAPLFRDATELRRLLRETGDAANYSGSAFKEYVARANTTGNVLAILKNKVADVFRGLGDDMLPTIKEAALGIGEVIDSLGERASIFDRMSTAVRGFTQGLGYTGGAKEAIEDLGDILFGKADGDGAADQLGRVFKQAEEWGKTIQSITTAIEESPITSFLGGIAKQGMGLALTALSISLVAGAVARLAGAMYWLSGAKAAVGILKFLSRGWKAPDGIIPNTPAEATPVKPGLPQTGVKAPLGGGIKAFMKGGVIAAIAEYLGEELIDKAFESFGYDPKGAKAKLDAEGGSMVRWWQEMKKVAPTDLFTPVGDLQWPTNANPGPSRTKGGVSDVRPMPSGPIDVVAGLKSITLSTKSVGVDEVHVTNPPPRPNITISVSQNNTFQAASDPAAAAAMGQAVGAAAKSAVEGAYTDGGL